VCGVTPNLSQINISLMSADGGFVFTTEGANKYSREVGEITNEFASTTVGDVRCVRGESLNSSALGDGNIVVDVIKRL